MSAEDTPVAAPSEPLAEDWSGGERRAGERRSQRIHRFFDRRHGFHRRGRHVILGTVRDHPWLLVLVLVIANALSVIDGLLTWIELELGIASEGNPVLDAAFQRGPMFAVAVKVGAMAFVTIGIWHGRRRRAILIVALLAMAVFAALVAYHLGALAGLGYVRF